MKAVKWKTLHSSAKQDWATPQALFEGLAKRFGPFNIDVCASAENAKVPCYFDKELDSLNYDWSLSTRLDDLKRGVRAANVCWMNPPYGRGIGRWMEKAYEESQKGCRVVCLVPSRTGSKWFNKAASVASEILLVVGRITFEGAESPAPFDSAVIVFEPADYDDRKYQVKRPIVSWITRAELQGEELEKGRGM